MKKFRKVLALAAALMMLLTLLAGCSNSAASSAPPPAGGSSAPAASGSGSGEEEKTYDPITFEMLFSNHDSQPYTEETWLLPKVALEKFNITLDMNAIPSASFEEKRSTTMASGDIPDFMMGVLKKDADQYGKLGMFLNFMDYVDQMPNMADAMENFADLKAYMPSSTEMYAQSAQITTRGSVSTAAYFIPMVRADLIADLDAPAAPATFDELHDMLTALKEANPTSYPWVNRQKIELIFSVFAPGLGINCFPSGLSGTSFAVWNADTKTFTNIFDEENFKFFIEFMNQLYNEGLLDPSYATDTTSEWESKIVSGAGSFAVDYFARPEMMSTIANSDNPDYSLEAILVPALPEGSQTVFARTGIGSWFTADAKTEHPERLAEFVDWWRFTEEGATLMTYGVEDETFTRNSDGTLSRIFTDKVTNALDFDAAYGTNYLQFWNFRLDYFGYDLYDATAPYHTNQVWDLLADKMIDSPPTIVRSTEEEADYQDNCADLLETMRTKMNEMIMGRRPIADWDAVKAEMDAVGLSFEVDMMNSIYQRIYG